MRTRLLLSLALGIAISLAAGAAPSDRDRVVYQSRDCTLTCVTATMRGKFLTTDVQDAAGNTVLLHVTDLKGPLVEVYPGQERPEPGKGLDDPPLPPTGGNGEVVESTTYETATEYITITIIWLFVDGELADVWVDEHHRPKNIPN